MRCDSHLFRIHLQVLADINSKKRMDIAAEEAILALVSHVTTKAGVRDIDSRRRPQSTKESWVRCAEMATDFLASGFEKPTSIAELARHCDVSPFHLCRIFKNAHGISIHKYRLQLRLKAALVKLAEGEKDLTQLALSLGFPSHSHFTNSFRACFGIPPSAFRRGANIRWIRSLSKNLQADDPSS